MPKRNLGTALRARAQGVSLPNPTADIKSSLQLKGLMAWGALALVLIGFNAWSFARGPRGDRPGFPQQVPQIQLAQSQSLASEGGSRAPAAVASTNLLNEIMAEMELPCPQTNEDQRRLALGPQVRQLRFVFGACASEVTAIRNQSNGFEATIFEQVGSDYISLDPEKNVLKVESAQRSYEIQLERVTP
ncbi:MAG TPA: hypothetical protein PLZ57_09870 [Pseudobdellovibrionaceae bacterium]|nr:hypothetical protein [Pseudobdellovibrionaceae bacterium]